MALNSAPIFRNVTVFYLEFKLLDERRDFKYLRNHQYYQKQIILFQLFYFLYFCTVGHAVQQVGMELRKLCIDIILV